MAGQGETCFLKGIIPITKGRHPSSSVKGYQMLSKIEINNFRCYDHLELTNLGRFNFVVGDNGTGKSSLLNAVYLCAGSSPEILIRTMLWRGLVAQGGSIALSTDTYKDFFTESFHNFQTDKDVYIRFVDTNDESRWLIISYGDQKEITLPLTSGDASTPPKGSSLLTFRGGIGDKETYNSRLELADPKQIRFKAQPAPYHLMYLNSVNTFQAESLVTNFSRIDAKNMKRVIVQPVHELFPEIEDISSIILGGTFLLSVASKHIANKIPVGSYSAGMTKFIHMISAIENCPRSIVLIDEIDNGLYYGKFESYMRKAVEFCERNDTQILASTHSLEFLRSLLPIMQGRSDFRLLRTERKNGVSKVKNFDSKHFESALDRGAEIR